MVRVAVGQMTSTASKLKNFDICAKLVREAVEAGALFLALPECFSFIGEHWTETVKAAEPLTGPSMTRYCNLAKEHGIWLSLGGFQEEVSPAAVCSSHSGEEKNPGDSRQPRATPSGSRKVFNTHVVISGGGDIRAAYRKIHLFDVAGSEMSVCESPAGRLGLSTCYDLRFPEMYACLAKDSQALLVPSAFTVPTGQAHWEVLLRARAIESQAYVIASAQVGQHNEKRASYGHSLIVDPWGKVLVDAGRDNSPCIRTAEIDLSKVAEIRNSMPIRQHRRAGGPLFAQELLEDVSTETETGLEKSAL